MAHGIITADQRLTQKGGVRAIIFGQHGIGKTSLIHTLPMEKTILLNAEAGELALRNWKGDSIKITDWPQVRYYVALIGGVDPAAHAGDPYSQQHYDEAVKLYGKDVFAKFENVFIDSLTELSRLCLHWAKKNTGNNDGRAAYGLLKQEVIALAKRLQHTEDKNIFLVGGLDLKYNEFKQAYWDPQIEGAQIALELPGILDEVFTLMQLQSKSGKLFRAIVTQKMNPYGVPAKDRSGQLNLLEEPHLGKIIEKCKQGTRIPNFDTAFPADINEEMPTLKL